MSVVIAEPPTGGVTVMPDSMIPKYPPYTLAFFQGHGRLDLPATPQSVMADSGAGLLAASATPSTVADLAGEGVMFASSVHSFGEFDGAGQLTAGASPRPAAGFTGSGTLAAPASPGGEGQFTGSGTLTSAAAAATAASHSGNGVLEALVIFHPVRMYKDATTYSIAANDPSWGVVTGWVADTAEYPESAVSSDALVLATGGSGITIAADLVVTNSGLSRDIKAQITRNGTAIASGEATVGFGTTTATITMQATGLSVNPGDLIRIQANRSASGTITVPANSASFVRVFRP